MVRALLENLLDADKIDHWFEGDCISLNKKAKPAPFASGLAATSNVLELLDSGDHVVEAGI
jgi:cystathionine beta-lyase/cystathionine gamma-synthase